MRFWAYIIAAVCGVVLGGLLWRGLMAEWDRDEWWMGSVIGALVLGLGACMFDSFSTYSGEMEHGKVVGRSHAAERNGTGVGPTFGSNGTFGTTVIATHEDEKWVALVEVDGDTVSVTVDSRVWTGLKDGDKVNLWPWYGRLSGYFQGYSLEKP